jgi:hypothetical protein
VTTTTEMTETQTKVNLLHRVQYLFTNGTLESVYSPYADWRTNLFNGIMLMYGDMINESSANQIATAAFSTLYPLLIVRSCPIEDDIEDPILMQVHMAAPKTNVDVSESEFQAEIEKIMKLLKTNFKNRRTIKMYKAMLPGGGSVDGYHVPIDMTTKKIGRAKKNPHQDFCVSLHAGKSNKYVTSTEIAYVLRTITEANANGNTQLALNYFLGQGDPKRKLKCATAWETSTSRCISRAKVVRAIQWLADHGYITKKTNTAGRREVSTLVIRNDLMDNMCILKDQDIDHTTTHFDPRCLYGANRDLSSSAK